MSALPPKADIPRLHHDVRFGPITDVASATLLDHLVGAAEQRQRNGDAERLSRLEINNHFNFCGLLNWKLRRLCAMKNLADIDASQTICVDEIGAITDQTASPGEVAKFGASRFSEVGFPGSDTKAIDVALGTGSSAGSKYPRIRASASSRDTTAEGQIKSCTIRKRQAQAPGLRLL